MFNQALRMGLRPAAPALRTARQSRRYASTGGNDPAEFKANTGPFKNTWVLVGVATALVGAALSTMAGRPNAAAAVAKESDPDAAAHMRPPNKPNN
ncbi:hypothetical protein ACHAQH_003660 [Verticillium albo-atrum]